jgi:hypothetical protein
MGSRLGRCGGLERRDDGADAFRTRDRVNTLFFPRAPMQPIELMRMMAQDNFHYIIYFQEPSVAESELELDVRHSLRGFYQGASDLVSHEQ